MPQSFYPICPIISLARITLMGLHKKYGKTNCLCVSSIKCGAIKLASINIAHVFMWTTQANIKIIFFSSLSSTKVILRLKHFFFISALFSARYHAEGVNTLLAKITKKNCRQRVEWRETERERSRNTLRTFVRSGCPARLQTTTRRWWWYCANIQVT